MGSVFAKDIIFNDNKKQQQQQNELICNIYYLNDKKKYIIFNQYFDKTENNWSALIEYDKKGIYW